VLSSLFDPCVLPVAGLGFEGVFSFFPAFFPEAAGFSSFASVDISLGCVVAGASMGVSGLAWGKGTTLTIKEFLIY
jgi:hypothetical protein